MILRAGDLMIFLGAGASISMPAGLPLFNRLRDEILGQLKLDAYVAGADSEKIRLAAGLTPEPFMLALSQAEIQVEQWLTKVLGRGEPNAVHRLVAELAQQGARVWTVNFDQLVENAITPSLSVIAWPEDPTPGATVLKPHGSLGGPLIVTAEQVLAGLDEKWLGRLRADVAGRTVIFLGYSGRDLDFQPHWDDVLQDAAEVLWFDWPDSAEQARKCVLLRSVAARGALHFPVQAPPPVGVSSTEPNPSWDFVDWCTRNGLGTVPSADVSALFERLPDYRYPLLPGDRKWARPTVLGLLGDHRSARRTYFVLSLVPRYAGKASRALAISMTNHGGLPVATLLRCARSVANLPLLRSWREPMETKRLSILANLGHHAAVLSATRALPATMVSTSLILRSAAMRMTGSLDDAADIAAEAYERALSERHPVRVANAAFQKCFALLWAERLDEARRCLDDELAPHAQLAAVRWTAWAEFLRGQIAVREGRSIDALAHFDITETRFRADGLVDGIVSARIARMAALRQLRDDNEFLVTMSGVERLSRARRTGQRYYTRRHRFTLGTIELERAEFARMHSNDRSMSRANYGHAASSPYALISALGHLGLALVGHLDGGGASHAGTALDIATRLNARLIITRARLILEQKSDDAVAELYFC